MTTLHRAISNHLDSRDVGRVIYGAIIGLAAVVALEAHPPAAGAVVGTLLGTAVAVGLAELYSEFVGAETRTRQKVDRPHRRRIARDATAVAGGIAFPALWFVGSIVGLYELTTAFTIAKWSGMGLIGCYGFAAGRLSGATVPEAILHALALGAIGAALIALKAILH